MKKLLLAITLTTVLVCATPALAVKGVVALISSGCDYYIVETPMGYALLEWYGGSSPSRGDVLVGDYESYGLRDVCDVTMGAELRVYVDDYWMSSDRVVERYSEKCR